MAVNMYGSAYSQPLRITGLASGMDTDSIVNGLMRIEQQKVERVISDRTRLEWRQEALTTLGTTTNTFRSTYLSTLSSKNMFSLYAYQARKVTMSSEKYFSITPGSRSTIGHYNVSNVKLAKYASVAGKTTMNTREAELKSDSYGNLSRMAATGDLYVIDRDAAGNPIVDADGKNVVKKVDDTMMSNQIRLSDLVDASGNSIAGDDGKISFSINNEAFNIEVSTTDGAGNTTYKTLSDMIQQVNKKFDEYPIPENEEKETPRRPKHEAASMAFVDGQLKIYSRLAGASAYLKINNQENDKFFGTEGMIAEGTVQTRESIFTGSTTLNELNDLLRETSDYKEIKQKPDLFGDDMLMSFSINGHDFSFNGDATVDDVLAGVNAAGAAMGGKDGFELSFDDTTGRFALRSTYNGPGTHIETKNTSGNFFGSADFSMTGIGEKSTTQYSVVTLNDSLIDVARKTGVNLNDVLSADGKLRFKLNGEVFEFDKTETIGLISSTLEKNAGVVIKYTEMSDKFTFQAKEMGTLGKVEFDTADAETQKALKLFGLSDGTTVDYNEVLGSDSSITVNGETYESTTNTFTVDGMSFDLISDFDATKEPDGVNFSITNDMNSVIDKVKEFVEEYNKMVEDLNKAFSERRNRKFYPLTEEQKDAMTEKEVEKWEEEAKKGILHSDSHIGTLINTLRQSIYTKVDGTNLSMMDLGVTTVTYDVDAANGGAAKIKLDEDQLRKMLDEDPEAVAKVFAQSPTVRDDYKTRFEQSGFMARVSDALTSYAKNVREFETVPNKQKIKDYNDEIDELNLKLFEKENKLWRQFTAMEKSLSQMQSTQSWLGAQMGLA